ncbi:sensor domain-containing protein [Mycolicibacterium sp. P1-5]|uniref:sensor domain-containing protein n=1 Tax=Mycolicibacterium sp. P1-5 TaxID=2024617 RepID=UPI0011ED8E95|nr:sensor domain-containing protein [Mycolicibacterium sp. P1-5]KAA0100329.1 sensor domain-containing protein [Mycolicibacterium sp. P1-5]
MAIAVLSGCSSTVGGSAARDNSAVPVRDLATVLPSLADVTRAAGNPLTYDGPAAIGGIDVLTNGIRDNDTASPIECLGPVSPFMRVVYERGDIRAAAWQEFSNYADGQAVSSVNAGVVAFTSDGEAQRMFSAFVSQWKACEGRTVTLHLPNVEIYEKVTAVEVDGSVLSATVVHTDDQGDAPFPIERSIGVAADCIVDVDAAVTGGTPEQQRATGRATRLAATMLENITHRR